MRMASRDRSRRHDRKSRHCDRKRRRRLRKERCRWCRRCRRCGRCRRCRRCEGEMRRRWVLAKLATTTIWPAKTPVVPLPWRRRTADAAAMAFATAWTDRAQGGCRRAGCRARQRGGGAEAAMGRDRAGRPPTHGAAADPASGAAACRGSRCCPSTEFGADEIIRRGNIMEYLPEVLYKTRE